jgi:tetratricopeptide (TPR) repeat protein
MSDLLDELAGFEGRRPDAVLAGIRPRLERERALALGWWHAADLDAAHATLSERLAALGLVPFALEELAERQRWIEAQTDDEEEQRRHQLGFAATYANARFGDERRFVCLGPDASWESGEPAWVLLNPRELEALRVLGGPPPALEAAYSGRTEPPAEFRGPAGRASPLGPNEAHRLADAAIASGRYGEALPYLERAEADGDHGLLARLKRIEVLHAVGRAEEARALWIATADHWLSGARPVWDTQLAKLVALHARLDLPGDDPRLPRLRERAQPPAAPPPRAPPPPCARCGGKGWVAADPASFPEICDCKKR